MSAIMEKRIISRTGCGSEEVSIVSDDGETGVVDDGEEREKRFIALRCMKRLHYTRVVAL